MQVYLNNKTQVRETKDGRQKKSVVTGKSVHNPPVMMTGIPSRFTSRLAHIQHIISTPMCTLRTSKNWPEVPQKFRIKKTYRRLPTSP